MVNHTLIQVNFFTPIQESIQQVEDLMRSQAIGHHPDLGVAIEHLLTSGGKRIRPAVALLTGGMYTGDPQALITLGAAIELLHTATLVHDDLIDNSLLRRGIATLNANWSPAATVLSGDFIFAQAAKLAAETNSIVLMKMFAETLATIVSGEITQMFSTPELVNRDDYNQRIYAKTASLFELSTSAAAILSPVNDHVVNDARQFGYEIGMAFQIVDDVLDFTGEQVTVGKPVANDLRQGIITLPVLFYLERNPDDPIMKNILDGVEVDDSYMDELVAAICDSDAIEQTIEEAHRYINSAQEILVRQPDCEERRALEELANYIVNRHM